MTNEDPVLARRARVATLVRTGQRAGYVLYGVALIAFVYGLVSDFTSAVASVAVAGLVAGSVLLAPAIILGYAVRAADRADRDHDW